MVRLVPSRYSIPPSILADYYDTSLPLRSLLLGEEQLSKTQRVRTWLMVGELRFDSRAGGSSNCEGGTLSG